MNVIFTKNRLGSQHDFRKVYISLLLWIRGFRIFEYLRGSASCNNPSYFCKIKLIIWIWQSFLVYRHPGPKSSAPWSELSTVKWVASLRGRSVSIDQLTGFSSTLNTTERPFGYNGLVFNLATEGQRLKGRNAQEVKEGFFSRCQLKCFISSTSISHRSDAEEEKEELDTR